MASLAKELQVPKIKFRDPGKIITSPHKNLESQKKFLATVIKKFPRTSSLPPPVKY